MDVIRFLKVHFEKFGKLPILMIENPPGALAVYKDSTTGAEQPAVFASFYSELIPTGYKTIAHTTVNATDFGLPQSRDRVIAFASADIAIHAASIIFGIFDNDPESPALENATQDSSAFIVDIGEAT
jgi:site-specific DNA-cytosine methylase